MTDRAHVRTGETPGEGADLRRGIIGVLPTVMRDPAVIRTAVQALDRQTRPCELVIIVFQGSLRDFAGLGEELSRCRTGTRIELLHSAVRSLTAAKNRAVARLPTGTRAVFIYEDDVSYPSNYNEGMLAVLEGRQAGMVSCVELRGQGFFHRLAAAAFCLSHLPPLDDRRPALASSPAARTIPTRFLSGGLTLVDARVFEAHGYDERLTGYCPGEDMDFSSRVSRSFPTYLTSTVRCVHRSVGIRRMPADRQVVEKLNAWLYFAHKNAKGGAAALVWLLVGLFADALVVTIRSARPAVLTAWVRSLRAWVLHGQYTSEYIRQ